MPELRTCSNIDWHMFFMLQVGLEVLCAGSWTILVHLGFLGVVSCAALQLVFLDVVPLFPMKTARLMEVVEFQHRCDVDTVVDLQRLTSVGVH